MPVQPVAFKEPYLPSDTKVTLKVNERSWAISLRMSTHIPSNSPGRLDTGTPFSRQALLSFRHWMKGGSFVVIKEKVYDYADTYCNIYSAINGFINTNLPSCRDTQNQVEQVNIKLLQLYIFVILLSGRELNRIKWILISVITSYSPTKLLFEVAHYQSRFERDATRGCKT